MLLSEHLLHIFLDTNQHWNFHSLPLKAAKQVATQWPLLARMTVLVVSTRGQPRPVSQSFLRFPLFSQFYSVTSPRHKLALSGPNKIFVGKRSFLGGRQKCSWERKAFSDLTVISDRWKKSSVEVDWRFNMINGSLTCISIPVLVATDLYWYEAAADSYCSIRFKRQ